MMFAHGIDQAEFEWLPWVPWGLILFGFGIVLVSMAATVMALQSSRESRRKWLEREERDKMNEAKRKPIYNPFHADKSIDPGPGYRDARRQDGPEH